MPSKFAREIGTQMPFRHFFQNPFRTRARELERQNQLLRAKYAQDAKYARIHKRLLEKGGLGRSLTLVKNATKTAL
jgi:hypothetical protein